MRLALVLLLAVAAPAFANVSRKDFPGARSSEPRGLREIAIEHEILMFDLRPLAEDGRPKITATYQLDNKGSAAFTAPLVFVSGMTGIGDVEVKFDGASVRTNSISGDASFPPAWNPPISTPSLDGGAPIGFDMEKPASVEFTVEIPPGRHTLAVSYTTIPAMTRSHGGATILWQVGYVLAPARDWGSFGTLDVSVEAPPDWRVATSLELARTGDTLRGKFTGLPSDTIGISASASPSMLHTIAIFGLPLLVVAVLGAGGYLLFRIGQARGRSANIGATWPLALGCALLWAIAIAVAGSATAMTGSIGIPEGQSASHGYGAGFGVLLSIVAALFVAVPIGFGIVRSGVKSGERIQ